MLQDKLENEMYNHISKHNRNIDLIVMHPKTWEDLVKEVINGSGVSINTSDPSLKYKGLRVLRSYDMEEDSFEVR